MLILSRNVGERIEVGDDMVIVITGLRKGRVQVGIEAPKEVKIRRGELPRQPNTAEVTGKAGHNHE